MKNEKNELKLQTQNNKMINSVMPDLALLVACDSTWCGLGYINYVILYYIIIKKRVSFINL